MNNNSPKGKEVKSISISIEESKAIEKEISKGKPNSKADKKVKKEKKHHAKIAKRERELKKPQTAYSLFCADKRAENKDKKLSAKELGQLYRGLPESKKEEYTAKYEEAAKIYEKDLAALNEKNAETQKEEKKKIKIIRLKLQKLAKKK